LEGDLVKKTILAGWFRRSALVSVVFLGMQTAWAGAHNGPGMPEIAVTETENLGDGLYTFPPQQVCDDSPCRPWGVLDQDGRDVLLIDMRPVVVH
jgi:hypothetical protein